MPAMKRFHIDVYGDALVMEAVAKPSCRDNGRDARYPDVGKAKYLNIGGFLVPVLFLSKRRGFARVSMR
jgi:hypothetical protein